jgi:polyphenol oxidase
MTTASSSKPISVGGGAEVVRERWAGGDLPLWSHPGWESRFPWLVQGTTGRGGGEEPFDLGLSGGQPVGPVLDRWRRVLAATGMATAVHSRQVHGPDLWLHGPPAAPGILVMSGVDGHIAADAGILLSVSVADCVPIFLVAEQPRTVALLHAGWRGVAAGILERAVRRMGDSLDAARASLWMHCGPAICGACYPVGPEVHRAVRPGSEPADASAPIDLRAALVERALGIGLAAQRCSVSAYCTRCGGAAAPGREFFSHRAGEAERQMGVIGIRS